MSLILGMNAYHGDASVAALNEGWFLTGVEEERFRRVKHWAGFPAQALSYCVTSAADGDLGSVECLAIARKPRAHLSRKVLHLTTQPRSTRLAIERIKNLAAVTSLETRIAAMYPGHRVPHVVHVEHHLAHIASAFYCSSFDEAACLSVDGMGDFLSTMSAVGRGTSLDVLDRVFFPHSLGILYIAITQYLGFMKYGDEYKVMGLAAYGEPRFVEHLRSLVPGEQDGKFRLDLGYFRHHIEGIDMDWRDSEPHRGDVFSPKLEQLLGPRRGPHDDIEQRHKDIAASLQAVYEERFFALVRDVIRRTGIKRLALAGGCAMNSVANGKLFDNTDVEDVYIQAAAGDAGTALGAALYAHHVINGHPRGFVMEHAYWGPEFGDVDIQAAIAENVNGKEFVTELVEDEERLLKDTAEAIAAGEVVGWYQGRSEWGPRALGNRSILADPRRPDMRDLLNLKIKRRESFRPFAPSILEERTGEWFTISYPDPFMIKVYPIIPNRRARIPAVTHVDGTGRLQTVSRRTNPRYWSLIRAFEELTGVPLVLNTSFNENEPIVNTPWEALDCFLRTKMDRIVLGNRVIRRRSTSARERTSEPIAP